MKFANRQTFKAIKRKSVDVSVPLQINGADALEEETFRLREMSGTERDRFEISAFKEVDGKRTVDPLYLRARLVALCLVDESGARLYGDDEIEALSGEIPSSVLLTLFEAAQKLNGLDAASVEAAVKNLSSGPPVASTSG